MEDKTLPKETRAPDPTDPQGPQPAMGPGAMA